jgi:hypothetical protein
MPAQNNQNAPSIDEWKKAVGNPNVKTEYSQTAMNYSHDLALEDTSFASKSADWASLAAKVFDTGKLRDANIVGADISDFKVKIADPADAKWNGLQEYIHDRKTVKLGNELTTNASGKNEASGAEITGEDRTYNTIDVGMLLLKGTDAQIKELMQGTFYNDKTIFIADNNFNERIHERLKAISKEAGRDEADKATNNYEGLRQESVAINSAVKETDGFTAGSPYTAVQGQKMGDGTTDIPVFSGKMAEPLVERNISMPQEQYDRQMAFQALHGLIARNEAIETIESRFTGADDRNQELQRVLKNSNLTFEQDKLQEYQVRITATAKNAYAFLSNQDVDAYGQKCHPDDPADQDLQKKRDSATKALFHAGRPVEATPVQQDELAVTGIMFNHTPSFIDGGSVKTLPAGDYLVGQDAQGTRYLMLLDDTGSVEVRFGVGVQAKGGQEAQEEITGLRNFFRSKNVPSFREQVTNEAINQIV